jgi:hypothetical protein
MVLLNFSLNQKLLISTLTLLELLLTGCGNKKPFNYCDSISPSYTRSTHYPYYYEILNSRIRRTQCALNPANYIALLPEADPYVHHALPEAPTAETVALQTHDTFFRLGPSLDQVLELLNRVEGVGLNQIQATLQIKRATFEYGRTTHTDRAPLIRTANDYSRLIRENLNGVPATAAYRLVHQELFFDTFLPFRDQNSLSLLDLHALEGILRNFPIIPNSLWYDHPVEDLRDDVLIGVQEAHRGRSDTIRRTAIANLTRSVRQLLDARTDQNQEEPLFKYYLVRPAPQPIADVQGRACHLYCGEEFDENHPGVHCLADDCPNSIHTRHSQIAGHNEVGPVELLDHLTHTMARQGATLPVTCSGNEAGHELYISDQAWTEMREGLTHHRQAVIAEITALGLNPDQPPAQLDATVARLQREVAEDEEALLPLRATLTELIPNHQTLTIWHRWYDRGRLAVEHLAEDGFNEQEIARLKPLIMGPDYQQRIDVTQNIRGRETQKQQRRQALAPLLKYVELANRDRQLQNWQPIRQDWQLKTLWAYYRHLRGIDERQLAEGADFRACSRSYCRNLIHRTQRNADGHYTCESCRETSCFNCDHSHPGQTCEAFEAIQRGDQEMQRLLHDPASQTRPCPSCLAPIFRMDGCDGVRCTNRTCNREFHWVHGLPPQPGRAIPHTFLPQDTPRSYRVPGDAEAVHTQAYRNFWGP